MVRGYGSVAGLYSVSVLNCYCCLVSTSNFFDSTPLLSIVCRILQSLVMSSDGMFWWVPLVNIWICFCSIWCIQGNLTCRTDSSTSQWWSSCVSKRVQVVICLLIRKTIPVMRYLQVRQRAVNALFLCPSSLFILLYIFRNWALDNCSWRCRVVAYRNNIDFYFVM